MKHWRPACRLFIANARAERQAVQLRRHSSVYGRGGRFRPVRSSEWFAELNLSCRGFVKSQGTRTATALGDRRPTASNHQLRSMPYAPDNSPAHEHPRLIYFGVACPDCRIWRLAEAYRARSLLFVLVANACVCDGGDQVSPGFRGSIAVRSTQWFAMYG